MSRRLLMFVCIILAGIWAGPHLKKVKAEVGPLAPKPGGGLLAGEHSPQFGGLGGQAHAELSSHQLEMRCRAPQSMIISWTTVLEENVAGYKVHRYSLDSQQRHEWVNPVPITAHGPGDYRIIDSKIVPGRLYLYRLYIFDDTYQLSRAEQIILANPAQPTCLHLPVISYWPMDRRCCL